MGKDSLYQKEKRIKTLKKYRRIISELPDFVGAYMNSIEQDKRPNTLVAYAYDLKTFFEFLTECNPVLSKKAIKDITLEDLSLLTIADLNEYKKYLCLSIEEENVDTTELNSVKHLNGNKGLARKLSPLKRLFHYYHEIGDLKYDYMQFISRPLIEKDKKTIVSFEEPEIKRLIDCVTYGTHLSEKQMETFEENKYRDIAIVYLFLETGIRVSECCDIEIDDVQLEKREIEIVRKGGGKDKVYFGKNVYNALNDYIIHVRNNIIPASGHEKAFFLSKQKRRLCVRSIENIVGKYTKAAFGKAYGPHKLRSSYGSRLYEMTGDIKLVADNLGNSPNVASKYYAKQIEQKQRDIAAKFTY